MKDQQKILFDALGGGHDIYSIPALLVPYSEVKDEARERALTAKEYIEIHGGDLAALEALVGAPTSGRGALPLMINNSHATVVLDKGTGELLSLGLPYN